MESKSLYGLEFKNLGLIVFGLGVDPQAPSMNAYLNKAFGYY